MDTALAWLIWEKYAPMLEQSFLSTFNISIAGEIHKMPVPHNLAHGFHPL